MGKYDDIINTEWPEASSRKERMDTGKRAKIFLPFAALTGYEASLEKTLKAEQMSLERKPGEEQFYDEENEGNYGGGEE